jgi:ABC-2 type transport system permease protein
VVALVDPTTRLGTLWQNRRVLQLLISRDLKVKYASSVLGYVWTILDPLMMAFVYWFVFTKLMERTIGEDPYIVFLLCAMLPWQWANSVLRGSMRALSKDAKLVRSTSLPREIWVLRTVGSKFVEFLFAIPVLVAFAFFTGAQLHWQVVYFPLAAGIQAVLLTGAGLALAPLGTLYGDVQRLMRIVLRLLFYFSPILYGINDIATRFDKEVAGVSIADVYAFVNPFAGIFDLYRMAFFPDQWVGWSAVLFSAVFAVVMLLVGIRVFRRFEGLVLKEI